MNVRSEPSTPAYGPPETRRVGVMIELHDGNKGIRIFREIIHLPGGKPMLGAPEHVNGPLTDSPYASVLQPHSGPAQPEAPYGVAINLLRTHQGCRN
jgi:hypothetical protein